MGTRLGSFGDREISKAIKYKILCRNDAGETIKEEEQYKPWPKLVVGPERGHTGSVLDIITYVTIREVTLKTAVENEAGAKTAGKNGGEPTNDATAKQKAEATRGRAQAKSKDLKSPNLEIASVGMTEMQIRSTALIKALQDIVEYYPSQPLTGNTVTVEEPYHFLLHHRNQLLHHKAPDLFDDPFGRIPDRTTDEHIKVLLAFLDSKYLKRIEEEELRYEKNPPTATFEMLWMLFKPGTRVFYKVDDDLAAFVVNSMVPDRANNPNSYSVWLWSLDFDGREVGRCQREVRIHSFSGEREIGHLKLFPIRMAPDKTVLPKLENLGKLYWDILRSGSQQFNYDGLTLDSPVRHHRGRVLLDPASFWSYSDTKLDRPEVECFDDGNGPGVCSNTCQCIRCEDARHHPDRLAKFANYRFIDPKNPAICLTREHFSLFPRKIAGFVLKSRTWAQLDLSCTSQYQPDEATINNLVMNENHLNMVKILTEKHNGQQQSRNAFWSADFIRSKGEGQILLLHGPPGVGKTYTAECIAEASGRPLLALSCADIGTNETKVEAVLSSWFTLAEIWGAVMLIDEADIYLETRSTGDLQRSSLVSAFLRSMEYYRGILFLTTNRVGHIDDAIMSRVHLVVRYKRLTPEARLRIWDQFVKKLEHDRDDFLVEKRANSYVQEFFEDTNLEWNGREIRNAIQTAVALAEHEAKTASPPQETVKLKTAHIKDVIEMSEIFKKYLSDFKGDEAQRALEEKSRMDKDKQYKPDMAATLAATREKTARRL